MKRITPCTLESEIKIREREIERVTPQTISQDIGMRETEDKAVRCFTDEVEMGNERRRQMLNLLPKSSAAHLI